jgi:hypothetical protein
LNIVETPSPMVNLHKVWLKLTTWISERRWIREKITERQDKQNSDQVRWKTNTLYVKFLY